jgi:hypothetical protein
MMLLVILALVTAAGIAVWHGQAAAREGKAPAEPFVDKARPRVEEAKLAPVTAAVRFAAVDIVIDSADQPLAVYQLEFTAKTRGENAAASIKTVAIVGIEGGPHAAFNQPPYYDPAAIQGERVIIAAFSTAEAANLPHGKVRVATIHLQITGDAEPEYQVKTAVTATFGGKTIDAAATVETKRTQS